MKSSFPPLNPLRVFDVAARCSSFTQAARELSVTQAAVSRQVTVLEGYLNTKLFERNQRRLSLTPAGRELHREIAPAFEMIGWATTEILRRQTANAVTIQTYPTFASKWLLPRLKSFLAKHEGLTINVRSAVRPEDYSIGKADILIRVGPALPEGLVGFVLCDDRVAPACSPSLIQRHGNSADTLLERARLLSSRYRSSDWGDWAKFARVDLRNVRIMAFDSSLLAYQAAIEGLGVVAAQLSVIESELRSRALVLPFPQILERDHRYWCLWSKFHRPSRPVRLVIDWLQSQMAIPAKRQAPRAAS